MPPPVETIRSDKWVTHRTIAWQVRHLLSTHSFILLLDTLQQHTSDQLWATARCHLHADIQWTFAKRCQLHAGIQWTLGTREMD